jgi:Transposase IS66 family
VRDNRPFAGPDPPATVFLYSPDRGGAHPEQHLAGYAGRMRADAYAGFGSASLTISEALKRPGLVCVPIFLLVQKVFSNLRSRRKRRQCHPTFLATHSTSGDGV